MQSNNILKGRSKLILWVFPLYFPQVANEHIKYVLCRWRTVDDFNEGSVICSTCDIIATSTVAEEDNIMFLKKFVYANSGSGLLFIMCGHCSPLVVWYNYHGT